MFTPEHIFLSLSANAIGLACVFLMKSAPPRLVLFVCLMSMAAILVPWQFIGTYFSGSPAFDHLQVAGLTTGGLVEAVGFSLEQPSEAFSFKSIWLGVGLVWIVAAIWRSLRIRGNWRKSAREDRSLAGHVHPGFRKVLHRVRFHRLSGSAMVATTGLWKVEVWIGDSVRTDVHMKAALNHELCHVAANDQITLFLVVIAERLLWWNPLVWLLGRHARKCMEYACDARCKSLLGQAEYRQSLAELYLVNQTPTSVLKIPFGSGSDVVNRMEKLKMDSRMKMKHFVALACAGALLVTLAANASSEGRPESSTTLLECHDLLPDGVQYDLQITSDIDTREGQRSDLFVNIVDPENPDSNEWPMNAMKFMECIRVVLGVGEDEGWPGT